MCSRHGETIKQIFLRPLKMPRERHAAAIKDMETNECSSMGEVEVFAYWKLLGASQPLSRYLPTRSGHRYTGWQNKTMLHIGRCP
jgi:hypothetical protein